MPTKFFLLLLSICGLTYCKKSSTPVCPDMSVQYSSNGTDSCRATGRIVIQFPVGAEFQYALDGGIYRHLPQFDSLSAGKHWLKIKDFQGCIEEVEIDVKKKNPGPLFLAMKQVLMNNCGRCHSGINPQAGHDWSNDCHILQHWQRIKARAVDADPAPMPPSGLITVTARNTIMDWINGGHQYEN